MNRVIAICGPTGSGKSALALALADQTHSSIVNYDSVQIFREFDIGSAKPSLRERAGVPHYLIDHLDPDVEFSAADYGREAFAICTSLNEKGTIPILAGGTGFYLRALLCDLPELPPTSPETRKRLHEIWSRASGPRHLFELLRRVDPVSASRIEPRNMHRVTRALEIWLLSGTPLSARKAPDASSPRRFDALLLGIAVDRKILVQQLDRRVEEMYVAGLVEETKAIADKWGRNVAPLASIGYREAIEILEGKRSRSSAIDETKRRTRAYAKRQMTWFRGEAGIHWLNGAENQASLVQEAVRVVESWRQ